MVLVLLSVITVPERQYAEIYLVVLPVTVLMVMSSLIMVD